MEVSKLWERELDENKGVSNGDAVNQPNHYQEYGMEAIDVIKNSMSDLEFQGYLKGNVMKYILRYRLKNGAQDLEKAEVYLKWLKESYEQAEEQWNDVR